MHSIRKQLIETWHSRGEQERPCGQCLEHAHVHIVFDGVVEHDTAMRKDAGCILEEARGVPKCASLCRDALVDRIEKVLAAGKGEVPDEADIVVLDQPRD